MMENNLSKNSITVQEICYGMFFVLLLFAKVIGLYDGQMWFKLFLVAAGIFWCAKMCLTSYSIQEIAVVFIICLLSGIVYLNSGEKGILLYAMLVTGMKT